MQADRQLCGPVLAKPADSRGSRWVEIDDDRAGCCRSRMHGHQARVTAGSPQKDRDRRLDYILWNETLLQPAVDGHRGPFVSLARVVSLRTRPTRARSRSSPACPAPGRGDRARSRDRASADVVRAWRDPAHREHAPGCVTSTMATPTVASRRSRLRREQFRSSSVRAGPSVRRPCSGAAARGRFAALARRGVPIDVGRPIMLPRASRPIPSTATQWRAAPSARCAAHPMAAPMNCAITKPGTSAGAMPAKLSLNMRPKAAAGLAKEVEAVNQYAAPM